MTTPAPRLTLEAIKRQYGPVIALDDAILAVASGEVHALLGENGAGKSTLMKIAFGLEQPNAGSIAIDGVRTSFRSPRDAMARGIGMVQQHFALVEAMTVTENVALGLPGRLDLAETSQLIRRISEESGLAIDVEARVADLAVSAQQRLEIIKSLARRTSILILDEPTAVLSPSESEELLGWTRRFADSGGTVILIAHKLREVLSVADRITVLRKGRTVLTANAADVTETTLADAMLGDSTARTVPKPRLAKARPNTSAVLELTKVSANDDNGIERLLDVSLTIHAGEMVGIAAVEGAGQRELLRILAGRQQPVRGTATIPAAIGFVPEDRHREAVVLDATLTENVALRGAAKRRGLMDWPTLRAATTSMMQLRDVRASSESVPMRTLSGGNQQKLVLGRELAGDPAALIVENPTRGLDIRATSDVHHALRTARDAGTAVIVYSSDLDEVLALADRVLVVAAGRVSEVRGDRETVGRAMLAGGAA